MWQTKQVTVDVEGALLYYKQFGTVCPGFPIVNIEEAVKRLKGCAEAGIKVIPLSALMEKQ